MKKADNVVMKLNKRFLAGYKNIHNKDERPMFFKDMIEESKKLQLEKYVNLFKGHIQLIKKNFKYAAAFFKKAIVLDDLFAYPWDGLGTAFRFMKEYKNAIDAYSKAIELDKNYAPPLNNLGHVYREKREYEKSIETYKKAIDLDNNFCQPWYNLGNVYRAKKEYGKAIEAYNKAIDIDVKYAYPWNALGHVYREKKEYENSIEHYKKAFKLFKDGKNKYWIFLTGNNIKLLKKSIRIEAVLANKSSLAKLGRCGKVLSKTKVFDEKIFENRNAYLQFLEEKPKIDNVDISIEVLRRWNSYTPIIADNNHISKGGGYFFRIKGKGIVIDPGFNFINNFIGAGHSFDEIDIVMVSHAHNDHTSDLESIITLLYTFNKKRKGLNNLASEYTVRADIAEKKNIEPSDVSEEDIENEFISSRRRKLIDLYITNSVNKKFNGMLDLNSSNDYKVHIIEEGSFGKLLKGNVEFRVIEAKHHDIISDRDAVGFIFILSDSVLIYTGDTGWSNKIEHQYRKIAKKYRDKHVVLLANLGGFKEYERNYLIDSKNEQSFYKDHLGRLGLVRINETLKPGICLISEFGEELKEFREELADIFNDIFNNNTYFLPADIGLVYYFNERKIRAITSINMRDKQTILGLVEPSRVKATRFGKDSSLHYFDTQAGFKKDDLKYLKIEDYEY